MTRTRRGSCVFKLGFALVVAAIAAGCSDDDDSRDPRPGVTGGSSGAAGIDGGSSGQGGSNGATGGTIAGQGGSSSGGRAGEASAGTAGSSAGSSAGGTGSGGAGGGAGASAGQSGCPDLEPDDGEACPGDGTEVSCTYGATVCYCLGLFGSEWDCDGCPVGGATEGTSCAGFEGEVCVSCDCPIESDPEWSCGGGVDP
jgi:hypothetical protein